MHDKDPRLEAVVERMFDRCIKDKEYKQALSNLENTNPQALGVALEARRPDTIIRVLETSKDPRSEERRVGKKQRAKERMNDGRKGLRDSYVTGVQTCALPIYA